MKTTKQFLTLAVAGLFFVACKDTNSVSTEETANETAVQTEEVKSEILAENLQTASFTIEGMHCEHGCAKGIEKKLAKLDGIKSAKVDFESKEATIEYDATVHTPQVLADVVKSMDDKYEVSNVKSSSDQSSLFNNDKEKEKKKEKKSKKSKKDSKTEASTTDKPAEKKGCCSGKSSCGSKEKSGSL